MTRAEFDGWIEQHYAELVVVARRRVKTLDAAQDAVQTAVVQMLTNGGFAHTDRPWTWAALYVRGACRDAREKGSNLKTARRDLKILSQPTPSHGRGGTK